MAEHSAVNRNVLGSSPNKGAKKQRRIELHLKLNNSSIQAIEKILEDDKTAIIKPRKDGIVILRESIKREYEQTQERVSKGKGVEQQ